MKHSTFERGIAGGLACAGLILAATIGLSASAFAQQTGTGTGTAAQGGNVQTYQDWSVRCAQAPAAQNGGQSRTACEAFQPVINTETNQPVVQVVVAYPEDAANGAVAIFTPLGVLLPAGVTINIDGQQSAQVPYRHCVQQGCVAQFALSAQQLASWKGGSGGSVVIYRLNGQEVSVPFSLLGFTAASDAVKQQSGG